MGILKKQGTAVLITLVAIAVAVGIGWVKRPISSPSAPNPGPSSYALDTGLDTRPYEGYVSDGADLLSAAAEKTLARYNANWDTRYNSIVAVFTTDTLRGADIEDYAYDQGAALGLGEWDAIIVLADQDGLYYMVSGDDFSALLTSQVVDQLDPWLQDAVDTGRYDADLEGFYQTLNSAYLDRFGLGNLEQSQHNLSNPSSMSYSLAQMDIIVGIIIFAVFFLLLASLIDRVRYTTYRQRYYGMGTPPVIFRPLLFWHGPRSSWYRRHWNPPPRPQPPPPPAGGFGGGRSQAPRGGGTFGGRPSGGISGFGGSRGGAGSRRGSSFGSTRSGGFGGARSSGKSRGSFGGSHRGSFGGSRGGRGGGFGGRR